MKLALKSIAMVAVLAGAGAAFSQNNAPAPLQNVVSLSASGAVEVTQDLLAITLNATRDGADAAVVQSQLKTVLDAALAEARKAAQPGQMDVRTGNFSLFPRYDKANKISGWQGTAELVLEGRDFPRIAATGGKIPNMTIANIGFGLSREQRAKVEGEAQTKAIEKFKAQATEIARNFGFSAFTMREGAGNSPANQEARPGMVAMAKGASMSSDAAIPVEAGKSTVVVNVSGSVQMR